MMPEPSASSGDAPVAKVAIRNLKGTTRPTATTTSAPTAPPSSKGRTSVALSNWDEHKARSVDNWASGLQIEGGHDDYRDSYRHKNEIVGADRRTMRFGSANAATARLSASLGDGAASENGQAQTQGHRENNGVLRGRKEAEGLVHPNLHLWSSSPVTGNQTGKEGGYSNPHTNDPTLQPPRGLPNTIPSRFASTLSASSRPSHRRDISKSSSTRSSTHPILVVPYPPHSSSPSHQHQHHHHSACLSTKTTPSTTSTRFTLPIPRLPKNFYKMRSSGPPPSLPPVSEFDISSILEWAKHDDVATGERGVAGDLERIAEICARSRLSLSNQYERHMPPHGGGGFVPEEGGRREVVGGVGMGGERGGRVRKERRGRGAVGMLETIYASSSSGRSSKDGKGRKKSAMELAEEVRTRKSTNNTNTELEDGAEDADHERSVIEGTGGTGNQHVRREALIVGKAHTRVDKQGKRRKRLAAVVIDTASSNEGSQAAGRLTSRPLKPRTSRLEMGVSTAGEAAAVHEQIHGCDASMERQSRSSLPPHEPAMPHLSSERHHEEMPGVAEAQPNSSVRGTFSTWLPWLRQPQPSVEAVPAEAHTETYFEVLPSAEGALKRLLDKSDKKSGRGSGERRREDG